MMASLSNKYERLKKIPEELEINQSFLLLEQDPSLPRRKRKAMELEHQLYIVGLHCQRELPEGVMSSMLKSKMINERPDKDRILSTDIAKILGKRSKLDKHGCRNGRAHKEPGECYQRLTQAVRAHKPHPRSSQDHMASCGLSKVDPCEG
ncbi:hypothetical protein Tco_0409533 [Tanacetum coccineum]